MLQIIGYADRMAVRPGETIEFKVSCEAGATRYRVQILRLICGDDRPEGPGFKAKPVSGHRQWRYPGRRQPIRAGSCIIVPPAPALDRLESFVLAANIWPTTPRQESEQMLSAAGGAMPVSPSSSGPPAIWRCGSAISSSPPARRCAPGSGTPSRRAMTPAPVLWR